MEREGIGKASYCACDGRNVKGGAWRAVLWLKPQNAVLVAIFEAPS